MLREMAMAGVANTAVKSYAAAIKSMQQRRQGGVGPVSVQVTQTVSDAPGVMSYSV